MASGSNRLRDGRAGSAGAEPGTSRWPGVRCGNPTDVRSATGVSLTYCATRQPSSAAESNPRGPLDSAVGSANHAVIISAKIGGSSRRNAFGGGRSRVWKNAAAFAVSA